MFSHGQRRPGNLSGRDGLSRRRFLAGATGLGLAVPLLAGCESGGDGGDGFGDRQATEGRQAGTEKFKGRLVLSPVNNPPKAAQEALTKAYQKHQPDVEIVWATKDYEPGEYITWLGTQLAAGEIEPDIVSGNYVNSFTGYVNLDQYESQVNPYTGNPWGEDLNFDFYRFTGAGGGRIMLPTQAVHINWFYNKDLFAKAGVEPPGDWDEFVKVCEKLHKAGITPVAADWDHGVPQWLAEIYFDQYHVDWVKTVRAQEGDWNYDPELDGKFEYQPDLPTLHNTYTFNSQRFYKAAFEDGKLRFDTPQIAEIVGNLARVFPRYATGDFFVMQDSYPVFLQQQAAIMLNGSWSLPTLTHDMEALSPERLEELGVKPGSVKPFEWGTFENPPMRGDLVKSPVRSVESSAGEYVSVIDKDAQQSQMAMDFVMFWLSKAGYAPYQDTYVKSGEFNPSGPLQVRGVSYPPEIQRLFDGLKMMGNAEYYYNGYWTTAGATEAEISDLHNLLKAGLEGKLSPEEYATRLQQTLEDGYPTALEAAALTKDDVLHPARRPKSI